MKDDEQGTSIVESPSPDLMIIVYYSGWWLNIFYFHPYLGKISKLTNIFQMGWNHQPVMIIVYYGLGHASLVHSGEIIYSFLILINHPLLQCSFEALKNTPTLQWKRCEKNSSVILGT